MNASFFSKILMIAALYFSYEENLFAQSADSIPAQSIPEVIVSATRTAKDVNDIGRDVTVISNAEIQKQGATTLAELLSDYAGIAGFGLCSGMGSCGTCMIEIRQKYSNINHYFYK